MPLSCIVRCMSLSRRSSWIGAKQPSEGDARTNPKRSSEMQEHRTGERKKERSIKHARRDADASSFEESLRPRTNPMRALSSTAKKLFGGNRPRRTHSPQKDNLRKTYGSAAGKSIISGETPRRPCRSRDPATWGFVPRKTPVRFSMLEETECLPPNLGGNDLRQPFCVRPDAPASSGRSAL